MPNKHQNITNHSKCYTDRPLIKIWQMCVVTQARNVCLSPWSLLGSALSSAGMCWQSMKLENLKHNSSLMYWYSLSLHHCCKSTVASHYNSEDGGMGKALLHLGSDLICHVACEPNKCVYSHLDCEIHWMIITLRETTNSHVLVIKCVQLIYKLTWTIYFNSRDRASELIWHKCTRIRTQR